MFDVSGQTIRISAGDTGIIRFSTSGIELTDRDRAVFTVKTKSGRSMFRKIIKPEKRDEVMIPFVNADTENMEPGNYEWDVRIVTDAKFGANGDVVDGTEVFTPFMPGQFTVLKVVGRV